MDSEIKRLLKLSNIPGFKISSNEQKILDEWKKAQTKIKPKKAQKTKTIEVQNVEEKDTGVKIKKTNQVKAEEKEIGKIEEV